MNHVVVIHGKTLKTKEYRWKIIKDDMYFPDLDRYARGGLLSPPGAIYLDFWKSTNK